MPPPRRRPPTPPVEAEATARDLAVEALMALDQPDARAREAVEGLRGRLVDPRDRALLTEIVYGVARRRATLDHLLARASKTPIDRLDPAVRASLRAGLYQCLFLERVPRHAAVDAAVESAKRRTNPRLAGFVNGVLRTMLRGVAGPATGPDDPTHDLPRPAGIASLRFSHPAFPAADPDPTDNLAARYAHPAWLVRRWLERFSKETTETLLREGCERAPISLRARPALPGSESSRDALVAELVAAGVRARATSGGETPDAVIVADGDADALAPVRDGRASVQDGTAQRVAALVAPRAGERILDLCAAPGGKTLHLLDLLAAGADVAGARAGDAAEPVGVAERGGVVDPVGEVVACDVSAEKVERLARLLETRRPARVAARAVLVPESGPLAFDRPFDAVLVDAPCSNTGVLRRRPEVRWRLRPRDLVSLAALQDALLERALPLVRPGGRLVYATCSIELEENEQRVEGLLAKHPGLERGPSFAVLPSAEFDGGFAVVFRVRRSGT